MMPAANLVTDLDQGFLLTKGNTFQHTGALCRMSLDNLKLRIRQTSWLIKDALWHSDLTDIVQG